MVEDKDKEWEKRILCSDEGCIGVIGPDGRCKECGLLYEGPLLLPAAVAPLDDPLDAQDAAETGEMDDEEVEESPADDPQWAERRLCADESCIGVIGPDGRCKECGKPYES